MTAGRFRLYPVEQHWCSFRDYGAILDVVRRLRARTVLEFGPGNSTLALIEGGATWIDACEDDPHWFGIWTDRLVRRFPDVVRLHEYAATDEAIWPVHGRTYDLALVDGPHDVIERPNWIAYAARRARHVLIPLETGEGDFLATFVPRIADAIGKTWERIETGPLAGAYGLIGPAS